MTDRPSRVSGLPASPVGAVRKRLVALRAAGREVIDLTAGDLDLPTPQHVVEAAIAALHAGETHYTPVGGTAAMKDAVRTHFLRQNGLEFGPEEIIVCNGSSQAIAQALSAGLVDGGDVLIPDPSWQTYAGQVLLAGGVPVSIRCAQNRGFRLSPAELQAAITPRTRWLIVNSPVNPTGAVYTQDELAALGQVLLGHPGVWVLADNLYEHNVFDGRRAVTLLQAEPRLRDRTVTVSGVAKGYAMTGWRIGWAAAPRGLVEDMERIQFITTSCPSSISQAAAIAALTGPQEIVGEYARILERRRDLVVRLVRGCPGLSCTPPKGTFYLCVSIAALIGKRTPAGALIEDGEDLAAWLLESHGLACLPGEAYGMPAHIRLAFAAPDEVLVRAAGLLRDACAVLQDP